MAFGAIQDMLSTRSSRRVRIDSFDKESTLDILSAPPTASGSIGTRWVTSVPSAGGAGVSGVTSLSSAASSAAFRGGDPVITGAAGQLLKSISTSPGSFAGTARIGGAIGRVANKVASSEAAGVFAALGLACIGGHP